MWERTDSICIFAGGILGKSGFCNGPFPTPYPKGSLAKGSWHGVAVTEGFTVGTPPKYKPVWKGEGFLVNREE